MKHVYFALSPLKTISLEELTTHKDKITHFAIFIYMHSIARSRSRSSRAQSRQSCIVVQHIRIPEWFYRCASA